ncbi:MAG: hypothetical protein PVS2B3_11280 [Steroidobacteraceae bacterium]
MRLATAVAITAAVGGLVPPARADDAGWRDIESRIQYNYYTEDARALAALEDTVAGAGAPAALRDYYLGLLSYRQALLAAQGAAGAAEASAGQLASRCVAHLDAALAGKGDFAEALALRAACRLASLASLASGSYAPLAAYRLHKDISRALQLAPGNPRVLLIDAISDYQLPPAMGGNKERALRKLRQAGAAFEAERREALRLPGWGAAEANVFLARDLLEHADAVAAREALESALIGAPQFLQARRLMAKIIAG